MSSSESPQASPPRRRMLRAAALLPVVLLPAGCGFQLRRAAELHFDSIALTGFAPRSPLARELRVALERSVTVKDDQAQAQVVLQALDDRRSRRAVAYTASGEVRDIQLRLLLRYRAQAPTERELVPESTIELMREMTFIEAKALGKQQEEQDLFREMQGEVVQQLLLRLSAIRL
jgi:LPS-assembly lipoprotein